MVLWKTVWRALKKLETQLPYDPAIPLLGMYPGKNMAPKDTCTPVFIAALFTIAKTWIKKIWYIYTYIYINTVEYYSAIKKE